MSPDQMLARIRALSERATVFAKAGPQGRKRIPGDGDGDGIAYEGRGKGGMPSAPKLAGPRAQAAVSAMQSAAERSDWRAVEQVNVLGLHPQVAAFKQQLLEHINAKDKALNEATGRSGKAGAKAKNKPGSVADLQARQKIANDPKRLKADLLSRFGNELVDGFDGPASQRFESGIRRLAHLTGSDRESIRRDLAAAARKAADRD